MPGQVSSGAVLRARPAASSIRADATYAFAVAPAFVSGGDTVPQDVLAGEALAAQGEGIAAAQGLLAAESVPVATTTVVEGVTLADSLAAAGEGLMVLEAGGAGGVEAATGPPGWIVGAVVLVGAVVGHTMASPSVQSLASSPGRP